MKKFRLIEEHSLLGGVCAGLAYSFGIKTWILRVLALLGIFGGFGMLTYILV